jgi:hypothetical protein
MEIREVIMSLKWAVLILFLGNGVVSVFPARAQDKKAVSSDNAKNDFKQAEGTVIDSRGLDGCGFLISVKNGPKINPGTLDPKFGKDGLEVKFKYRIQRGISTICMSGVAAEVKDLELVKKK